MRLLVSNNTKNPGPGGLYLVDTRRGNAKRIFDQPCRGITRGPGGQGLYFVTNQGRVCSLEPETWRTETLAEIGIRGSHDLRYIDGHFYLVVSDGNQVIRLDRSFREVDRLVLLDDPGDVYHVNCLVEQEGQLLLSLFTLSPGRREEKRLGEAWRTEGKVVRLDWPAKRFDIVYDHLQQPHSLTIHGNELYCVESFTSTVTRLRPGGRAERLRQLPGFARGLAWGEGSAWAGISLRNRNQKSFKAWLERLRARCGVLELDPVTWKPRRHIPIPGVEIYELLVLDR